MIENEQPRICIVGAGKRFLSGISYYTLFLANTLARSHSVSVVLMRQLLPTRLYPGRERVGASITDLEYDPDVHIFDGVDWFWLPSIFRSLLFLRRERPDVVIFQWWSGTVLHSYLLLMLAARLLKAQVVIEFHEVLDTGEARLRLAQAYVRFTAPLVVRLAHGFVVHSDYDRQLLKRAYSLDNRPIALIPHGPFNQYQPAATQQKQQQPQKQCEIPASCCNLLYFGVIRPYKGLEDLIKAFDALPEETIANYWLTIVGETWEGWTLPADLIKRSRYRERITFINRYVPDAEVTQYFKEADVVVLPYHRSSTSGPLHIAMSCGLPVIVTRVGGLIEAVTDYEGAVMVPPENPIALRDALLHVPSLRGRRFTDTHSWEQTIARYQTLFQEIRASSPHSGQSSEEIVSVS